MKKAKSKIKVKPVKVSKTKVKKEIVIEKPSMVKYNDIFSKVGI